MRKKIVAGNWKMNTSFQEAESLIASIKEMTADLNLHQSKVVVCPPFPYLEMATDLANANDLGVGAQNVSEHEFGAYTGEVSAAMLESMEVGFCIVGHSERRKYFKESDETIAKKTELLLKHDIVPIFCCGESLEEREAGRQNAVVENQIKNALFHLEPGDFDEVIIAYEPVWAIGTGKTATPDQAQEMHAFIRSLIEEKFGKDIATDKTILYGGSCNPKNAKSLFKQEDIDGGLIGGASLDEEDFIKVIKSLPEIEQ